MTRDMQAIEISAPGGPEVLRPCRRPLPEPGPNDVLIEVAAAGVNRPDCLQRQGLYPPPPGASDLPGLEVAGRIAALGSAVRGWAVGDPVCALLGGGGYAAYAVAAAGQCLPVPEGLDAVQAASLPETFFTVWSNLFQRAGLRPGETLLVHAGASGIGTTAIQLARASGVRALATCGSDAKLDACLALGAERVINYRQEDFAEAFADERIDVILDIVGGDYTPRNLRLLAPEGRLVQLAFLRGAKVQVDLATVMLQRLTLTGSTLRAREPEFKAGIARELRAQVWPLLSAGRVRPIIHQVLPLAEAAEAHRLLESDQVIGKLVLRVDG